jgi:hypothetical protein
MESPRNRQAKEGEAPNRLGIAQAASGRSLEKKGVQMQSQGPVKGFYTEGYQTCPVRLGFLDMELGRWTIVWHKLIMWTIF